MFTTTNLEKQIRKLREAINYRDWQLDRLNVAIKQKDEEIEHLNNVVKVKEQQADSPSHMLEDKKTEITMLNKENKKLQDKIETMQEEINEWERMNNYAEAKCEEKIEEWRKSYWVLWDRYIDNIEITKKEREALEKKIESLNFVSLLVDNQNLFEANKKLYEENERLKKELEQAREDLSGECYRNGELYKKHEELKKECERLNKAVDIMRELKTAMKNLLSLIQL